MEIVRAGPGGTATQHRRPQPAAPAAEETAPAPAASMATDRLGPGRIMQTALEAVWLEGYQPPPQIAQFPAPDSMGLAARRDQYLAQMIIWTEAARQAALAAREPS